MARNNDLVVTAGLNIEASVAQIEKDLKQVNDRLSADHALKIIANVDLSKTTQRINSQLATISKNIKLDIPKVEISTNISNTTNNIMSGIQKESEQVAKSIDNVSNSLRNLADTYTKTFTARTTNSYTDADKNISYLEKRLSPLGNVSIKGIYSDNAGSDSETGSGKALEALIATIKNAQGELRTLRFELNETGNAFEYVSGTYNDSGVAKVQQDYARLEKELANFRASHKAIEDGLTEPLEKAQVALDNLKNHIGSVDAVEKAFDSLKTSAADIAANLKSTGSSFNIFDNAANKAKNFDNIIKGLELDINNLNQESNKSNLLNSLDEARQKLQQLQNVESQFGKGVEWSKNYKEVSELLQTIANDLKVVQREEKKAFQDDNRAANLQNRIKRLTADVNAYGEANERATKSMRQMSNGKTFAVEWSRITTEMAKGADLTDRELKDLSADMAVFKKEAQAAGLAGESAFGKFLNSFKTMSSYVTANMVFNFVKRQVRELVNEVTAVDTAMVELRKVTEATDEQFEAFAISAGKTGRELGASVSDVINATSTFSRAGYNLPDAEELGKIATLYKNVGDGINIDTASESLISVMKAFNIEAKDSISVIDKINDVSNKAAIESGGLGLALQRVASAMKASQNTLDETIAIITASNEIVENPEMVANGWRTVALRIRGAKTELEQAGEDTEGMVESTAKLRDLVKGISGVDIMLDENTFKSTYQIITEIGKVWHNISDINQASLLEAIAGRFYLNVQKCA